MRCRFIHADIAEVFYQGGKKITHVLANSYVMFTEGLTITRQDNLGQQCLHIYSVTDAKLYYFLDNVQIKKAFLNRI